MYMKLGYSVYRRVLEYYSGDVDEDAFGKFFKYKSREDFFSIHLWIVKARFDQQSLISHFRQSYASRVI